MTRHGTMRPLAVTFAVALMSCVYTGVASAEESLVAAGGEAEAVAETSESAVLETSQPAHAVRKGKKSTQPAAETSEPVSTASESSAEPVAETSEPVSTVPEPSAQPVAGTIEPVNGDGVIAPAEPPADISDALILMSIPGLPIDSSLPPKSINILRDVFSDLAAVATGDPRAPVRTDRRGAEDGPPVNDDPSPLPGPGQEAPVPVAPAGASGAPGGGSSGGFIALTAFLLLASLPLSRVVELSLTRLRSPRLVADLARPD